MGLGGGAVIEATVAGYDAANRPAAAMQIFGGYCYSKEFPVERMLRHARAWGVAGGTVQVLRLTMASVLYGRRFDQRRGK
jgi:alkylation response protein AidB-like acyl-CoA dehydrogenase